MCVKQRTKNLLKGNGMYLTLLRAQLACATIVLAISAGAPSVAIADTFNEPSGIFLEPGALGLCQCLDDKTTRHTSCLPATAQCRTACGGKWSYVPNAGSTCAVASPESSGTAANPK